MYFLELQYTLGDCTSDDYEDLKYCWIQVINSEKNKQTNEQTESFTVKCCNLSFLK